MGTKVDESADPPESDGQRHPVRVFFARHPALDLAYRLVVGVIGTAVVLAGIALIPLPGPGWLIVFAGLALLATEFAWAGRLLDFARSKVRGWTDWVTRQSVPVRAAIGLGSLIVLGAAVWLYLATQGVPGWLPSVGPLA